MSMETLKPLRSIRGLRWFHWGIVALSLCLTLFAWSYSRSQLNGKIQIAFDREADQVAELVVERMHVYEEALWSGVAFIETFDGPIEAEDWNRYASAIHIEQKYPGINGIGVINFVPEEQKDAFLNQQQKDRPRFSIHPVRESDEYWPITHIVPLSGNEQALGLDIGFEANRLTGAIRSRQTATAQATGPITLVQDAQQTPGFLFFAPFYDQSPKNAGRPKGERFAGLVYAPFVTSRLMKGTLDKEKRQVGIRINDADAVLFDEHQPQFADFDPNPLLRKTIDVPFYGRKWTFDIWSAKSFRDAFNTSEPMAILIAGLLIDSLLIGLLVMLARDSRLAQLAADGMSGDLEKLGLAARVNKIGIWDFDPVNNKLAWDDAMFELYGRRRDDFSQAYDAWSESLHPEDRQLSERALKDALVGKREFDCEFRVIHPNGEVRHISAKAAVFRDDNGIPYRMLGANTDVTEQSTAKSELESTRRLQGAIQDAAGVCIVVTDVEGTIMEFNAAAMRMLGYERNEVVGKTDPRIFHDKDEVEQRAKELSVELGQTIEPGFQCFVAKARLGEFEQREWTYVRKDGTTFPALLTVTALRDQHDKVVGFLGIAADITDRKKVLQRLEDANESLARSNEDLAQYAYVASHDLQEPLRKVTAFCELLEQDCADQLSEDGQQYMKYIVDGAVRMRTLIHDLLAYSRIESNCNDQNQADLNQTVQYSIDNLSETIEESGGSVTFDTLPIVRADPSRMLALFQNLIGNAIKYHGSEAPRVHVSCSESDGLYQFAIADNGIGIESAYRDQVFGVFKRLHSKTEYPGTGIGLAICKRIIDQLGGRIWVEDTDGGGATFRFEIPVAPKGNPEVAQDRPRNLADATLPESEFGSSPAEGLPG